ncbi:MAG TPA: isoprenylcysteine carboxylmethyltransferase family protein [Flavihumibacter sp.]
MDRLLEYYLPLFILIYFSIIFVLPTVRIYRKTGINPVTFGKSDNAHDYIGGVMKFILLLLALAVGLYPFRQAYKFLCPIEYLNGDWLKYAGMVIIHSSLVWIMIAQYQMKQSWRIGIDEAHKTSLVTEGVFSISRNPIFLGMICTTMGTFLIIPNAITLLVAVMTYFVIQIQIRLEEEYLLKQHGELYAHYKNNVGRLL